MQRGIISAHIDLTKSPGEPKPPETEHLVQKYQIEGNEMSISPVHLQMLLPQDAPFQQLSKKAMEKWHETPEVGELKAWLKDKGHFDHLLRLNSLSSLPEFLEHLYGPLHEMEDDLPEHLHPENLQTLYFCKSIEVWNSRQFRLPLEKLLKELAAEVEAQHETEGKPIKVVVNWLEGLGVNPKLFKQPGSDPKWIVKFNEVERGRIK